MRLLQMPLALNTCSLLPLSFDNNVPPTQYDPLETVDDQWNPDFVATQKGIARLCVNRFQSTVSRLIVHPKSRWNGLKLAQIIERVFSSEINISKLSQRCVVEAETGDRFLVWI
jgi:hypothetical protein